MTRNRFLASVLLLACAAAGPAIEPAVAVAQVAYHPPPPPPPPPPPGGYRGYRTRSRGYVAAGVYVPWYMGLGVVGTSILSQSGGDELLEPGGGLNLWGGLHLSERLSLELGWLGSLHNPATVESDYGRTVDYLVLGGLTADARVHFAGDGDLTPFLQGGVGLYYLGSQTFGTDSVGAGFQLGGGFDYWVGGVMTLGLRARYHGIAMGPPHETYNDTFINAATVEGSLGLHF